MNIIVLLILISVFVAIVFLVAFYWAIHSGQYEDTDSPSVRMLIDDRKVKSDKKTKKTNKKSVGNRRPVGSRQVAVGKKALY